MYEGYKKEDEIRLDARRKRVSTKTAEGRASAERARYTRSAVFSLLFSVRERFIGSDGEALTSPLADGERK